MELFLGPLGSITKRVDYTFFKTLNSVIWNILTFAVLIPNETLGTFNLKNVNA
jgi:hypothetical protein